MNEMVTITREEYQRLLSAAEDLADIAAYDRAKAALACSCPKCTSAWRGRGWVWGS